MKKILFLLLSTIAMYGQVPADATPLENIQITNNTTDNSATKVNVQSTDGTINTIPKSDLVNVVEVNDVPTLPLVGEVGKIYVVKNVNKIYRWNGTFYQELAGSDISGLQAQIDLKENAFSKNTAFNKNFGTTVGTVVEGGTLGSNAYNSTAYLPLTGGTLSGALNGTSANFSSSVTVGGNISSNGAKGLVLTNGSTWEISTDLNNLYFNEAGISTRMQIAKTTGAVTIGSSVTATSFNGSATLTGTPTAPTATVGTNTTQVATTAFVLANASVTPNATTSVKGIVKLAGDLGGTADLPTVPALVTKANLASPALTGTPTAPTATAGTNTTQIATTAFVQANSSARPYKVYTALLNQSGTDAPVATVLENTLGGTVVWSRVDTGKYLATLTGAFTGNKTVAFFQSGYSNPGAPTMYSSYKDSDNAVRLYSLSTGFYADQILSGQIQIRVYN